MVNSNRTPRFVALDAPIADAAQALYAYWKGLPRVDDVIPKRTDILLDDLVALRCADRAFVLEPAAGNDWSYRLLGSEIVRHFGRDVTGIPLREHMYANEAEEAIRLSNEVARTCEPIFLTAQFSSGEHSGAFETMSLPIRGRNTKDVWLFGGSFFTPDS